MKVLFICVGNSARSQIAEALFKVMCKNKIECFSAGSNPSNQIHPIAAKLLTELNIDITTCRPKSWNEFSGEEFDYIISLCEEDAEDCPVILSKAAKIKWHLPDPAGFEGDSNEIEKVFRETLLNIRFRINGFLTLVGKKEWQAKQLLEKEKDLQQIHEQRLVDEMAVLYHNALNIIPPRSQELLCIHLTDLKLVIKETLTRKIKGDIKGSASLTLATAITLLSADFKHFFFTSNTWVALFTIIMCCSAIYLVYSIYSKLTDLNDKQLEEQIIQKITNSNSAENCYVVDNTD